MRTVIDALRGFAPERFFREYFGKRPVVIQESISHWPASRHWSLDYLKRCYGDAMVTVTRYDPEANSTFLDQTLADVHHAVPLRDFLSMLEWGDRRYAVREDTALLRRLPQLIEELERFSPFSSHASTSDGRYKALWIGPPGYVTGLHTDPGDTMLFQLHGRKHVLLFAPDQTQFLYEKDREERQQKFDGAPLQSRLDSSEFGVLRDQVRWCDVQPFDPDVDRFPLFRQAHCIEAYICPGDALYIPDQWWHAVRSLDPTISVSIEPSFDGRLFQSEA